MKIKKILSLLFVGTLLPLVAKDDRLVLVGTSYGKNVLAICDSDGGILWKQKTAGPQRGHAGHHDIHLLKNGNILFHDTWSKTQEVTLGKKTVWEYESAKMNGNEGKGVDVHAFARFPDGSTIVAESGKDGKVVWEYSTKTRVFGVIRLKNGNTLIATGSGNSVIEVRSEWRTSLVPLSR